MRKLWHLANTGNHQGLVTCSETGDNVAVTYARGVGSMTQRQWLVAEAMAT